MCKKEGAKGFERLAGKDEFLDEGGKWLGRCNLLSKS